MQAPDFYNKRNGHLLQFRGHRDLGQRNRIFITRKSTFRFGLFFGNIISKRLGLCLSHFIINDPTPTGGARKRHHRRSLGLFRVLASPAYTYTPSTIIFTRPKFFNP